MELFTLAGMWLVWLPFPMGSADTNKPPGHLSLRAETMMLKNRPSGGRLLELEANTYKNELESKRTRYAENRTIACSIRGRVDMRVRYDFRSIAPPRSTRIAESQYWQASA